MKAEWLYWTRHKTKWRQLRERGTKNKTCTAGYWSRQWRINYPSWERRLCVEMQTSASAYVVVERETARLSKPASSKFHLQLSWELLLPGSCSLGYARHENYSTNHGEEQKSLDAEQPAGQSRCVDWRGREGQKSAKTTLMYPACKYDTRWICFRSIKDGVDIITGLYTAFPKAISVVSWSTDIQRHNTTIRLCFWQHGSITQPVFYWCPVGLLFETHKSFFPHIYIYIFKKVI